MTDSSLPAYLREQMLAALELDKIDGGWQFKNFLKQLADNSAPSQVCSPVHSANAFIVIRYGYPLVDQYVASVLEATIETAGGPVNVVYGYALWPERDFIRENPEPEYVVLGSTFESQDGEYRTNMLWWKEFLEMYDLAFQSEEELEPEIQVMGRTETLADELISEGKLRLDATAYPRDREYGDVIARRVDDLRIAHRLFVAQLFPGILQVHSPHIKKEYVEFINAMKEALFRGGVDPELLASQRYAFLLRIFRTGNPARVVQTGAKIIPMTLGEFVNPGNLRYGAFREAWVAKKLSDLRINGRARFPYYNQDTLVRGVDSTFFENSAMERVYHKSEVASSVIQKLEAAREAVDVASELDALDADIHRTIRHSEDEHLLSENALLVSSEWVGYTLASLPYRAAALGVGLSPDDFTGVVFDIVYGLLAMHEFAIHGDAHSNNTTVNRAPTTPVANTATMYVTADSQKDVYILPAARVNGYIIDNSRVIINPGRRPELVRLMGEEQTDAFFREQADRMMAVIARWLPSVLKKSPVVLKGAAFAQPQQLYDAMAALDYLAVGRSLCDLFVTEEGAADDQLEVSQETRAMLEAVRDTAQELAAESLKAIADGKKAPRTAKATGQKIIAAAFGKFRFTRWDPKKRGELVVCDAYSLEAPLKYSGSCPEEFPPWARMENLVKFSGGLKVEEILSRTERPLLTSMEIHSVPPDEGPLGVIRERARATMSTPPEH